MSHLERRERLLALLEADQAGPILLTDPADIRWLTGLNSSNAAVVLGPEQLVLATDNRYAAQARALTCDFDLVVDGKVQAASIARYRELAGSASLEPTTNSTAIVRARAVKDSDELVAIEQACKISVAALAKLRELIRPGQTEVEVARTLELEMAKLGAEDRAFPTIVAAGENSAIPHHSASTRELQVGELLKIDFGACFQGYNADCTRTFVIGAEPTRWQTELHEQVLAASVAAKQAVQPGMLGGELDLVARTYLQGQGLAEQFLHGLGHGVGLDVHEYPFLTPKSEDRLLEHSVFTIEPGLYLEGKGGVRIEDTCALIAGELVVFTESDRGLLSVS